MVSVVEPAGVGRGKKKVNYKLLIIALTLIRRVRH